MIFIRQVDGNFSCVFFFNFYSQRSSMSIYFRNFHTFIDELVACEACIIRLFKFFVQLFFLFLWYQGGINQLFYCRLIIQSHRRRPQTLLLRQNFKLSFSFRRIIKRNIILLDPSQACLHKFLSCILSNLTLEYPLDWFPTESKYQNLLRGRNLKGCLDLNSFGKEKCVKWFKHLFLLFILLLSK